MMLLLFIALFIFILLLIAYSSHQILLRGNYHFMIVFILLFLPEYTVFLAMLYKYTGSVIIVKLFQVVKEVMLLLGFGSYILHNRNIFTEEYKPRRLGLLFISFIGLSLVFLVLPIGEAGFIQKLSYFRIILMAPAFYFIGTLSKDGWIHQHQVFRIILIVGVMAAFVAILERLSYTHLHQLIGFAEYNQAVNDTDPSGSYGLTWTFQAQFGIKRFAAFFSNPLEMAASLLMCISAAFALMLHSRHRSNQTIYLLIFFLLVIGLVMTYSRASIVAFLSLLLFSAWILRYYRLLLTFFAMVAVILSYLLLFSTEDVRYYVEDTLTFQNPSSIGHALEWFEAVESMIDDPQGIGLATSGNAGDVEEEDQVGGENQFFIYGVQLGVLGLLLYLLIYIESIRVSIKGYRNADSFVDKCICFVAATTKFGLFLPLFTSNAELYGFVSFTSWWMVGYASAVSGKKILVKRKDPLTT